MYVRSAYDAGIASTAHWFELPLWIDDLIIASFPLGELAWFQA